MKYAVLTSIAHNVADSLASGNGLLVGVYDMDVFGEAERSRDGFIEVDFLNGVTVGGKPTKPLAQAIKRYSEVLPSLCERHGASMADFRRLTARYSGGNQAPEFVVEISDRRGKLSRIRYVGIPGRLPITVDPLGRVRRVKSA